MTENTDINDIKETPEPAQAKKKAGTGGMFVDIIACVIIPTLILKKLSGDDMLGPSNALILALALPFLIGLYGFLKERKVSFIPALGFISILLTGGIGLLHLPKEYIAYKEALVPGLIALAAVISIYTKHPFIRAFIYNDDFVDTDKVGARLEQAGKTEEFDQMMVNATWIMTSSFILSSILNYVLAKWIVVAESGTPEFNDQLGTMALWSYPVIALPCSVFTIYALFYVMKNIKRLTGLELEEVFRG